MLIILCFKFHKEVAVTSLKTTLIENLSLSSMGVKRMNRRANVWSEPQIDRTFETMIIMLMILCVNFHEDVTLTSLKTTLTKSLNLSGTDGRTDRNTICPPHTSYAWEKSKQMLVFAEHIKFTWPIFTRDWINPVGFVFLSYFYSKTNMYTRVFSKTWHQFDNKLFKFYFSEHQTSDAQLKTAPIKKTDVLPVNPYKNRTAVTTSARRPHRKGDTGTLRTP